MTSDAPVWLITGCSSGLGRAQAEVCIEQGFRVVVTARDVAKVADLARGAESRVLAAALDVVDHDQIALVVEQAKARFGRIDVLVNNAGYGYQTSVEEGEEARIRAQFDANVFGLFALTRAVLPVMRARKSGHVINITSVGGLLGLPGSGYYSATKHAVEGWSDALKAEVSPLGLQVTCVEPGPFRTDWAGRSLEQTKSTIPDYAETAAARMAMTSGYSGSQPGDPVRAAQTMIDIALTPDAPRHLVLGKFGYDAVTQRYRERLAEIESLHDVALAADFPDD